MGGGELYIPTLSHLESTLSETLSMSQHNSLKAHGGLVVKRNVLKRFERVEILKKRGQWKEGDRVQGLRKTKPDV
jgi:small basic protein (TIGR04137 family)